MPIIFSNPVIDRQERAAEFKQSDSAPINTPTTQSPPVINITEKTAEVLEKIRQSMPEKVVVKDNQAVAAISRLFPGRVSGEISRDEFIVLVQKVTDRHIEKMKTRLPQPTVDNSASSSLEPPSQLNLADFQKAANLELFFLLLPLLSLLGRLQIVGHTHVTPAGPASPGIPTI